VGPAIGEKGIRPAVAAVAAADSVEPMAGTVPSESTPQRLAAIREQMSLLSDYL
jgi:hypothetical protein